MEHTIYSIHADQRVAGNINGAEDLPIRPNVLGNEPTDDQKQAHDEEMAKYLKAVKDMGKRNNEVWCYLAMMLDNTSLMLLRHVCLDNGDMGDGHKTWRMLHQRFCSDVG